MTGAACLGVMYQFGTGVPKDEMKALSLFMKAVDQGDTVAMTQIGQMYQEGSAGLRRNEGRGIEWFRNAAKLGEPNAMANLGRSYEMGLGVPKDPSKAIEWYRKG